MKLNKKKKKNLSISIKQDNLKKRKISEWEEQKPIKTS